MVYHAGMHFVGGNLKRCGGPLCLAVLFLVSLLQPSFAATFPPPQQAVLDSLNILHRSKGPDGVARLVAEQLPAARAAGDSAFVMRLVGMRGGSHASKSRALEAEADLEEALALARALGDSVIVARSVHWLVRVREVKGDQSGSAEMSRQLLRLAREQGNGRYEGRALNGLAWNAHLEARYAEAESLSTLALERSTAARDTFFMLWASNNLGLSILNQGHYARADSILVTVIDHARQWHEPLPGAAALNNHAGIREMLGWPDEALVLYRQSRDLYLGEAEHRGAVTPAMNVGRCQHMLGRLDQAAETFETLYQQCLDAGFLDLLAGNLEHLAMVRIDQQRPALASRICRQGLTLEPPPSTRHQIQLEITLARALADRDSTDAALASASRAYHLRLDSGDGATEAWASLVYGEMLLNTGHYAEATAVLSDAAHRATQEGKLSPAIALRSNAGESLRRQGKLADAHQELHTALDLWETNRTLPKDPMWRERQSNDVHALFESLTALSMAYPDSQPLPSRQRQTFDLLQQYKGRTLLERALGPGRELADPIPVTLDELQHEILVPGEVFLETHVGENGGLIFAVSRDTLLVADLANRQTVGTALELIRTNFANPALDLDRDEITMLGTILLPELDPGTLTALLDGCQTLIWSPDRELHQLPLAAVLPDAPPLVRTPSATFLASMRRQPRSESTGPARILATAGLTNGTGQALAGARAEVKWLAHRYQGVEAVIDSAASEPFGGFDPEPYDLLHIAAHAEIDPQRPWNSALVFGQPGAPIRLLAGDVAEWHLEARLAVLASCGSAGGAVLSGEGMLGLASGFLSAGVPSVLATLWAVDDRQAEKFTHRFYTELAKGHAPATALQHTQRWMRDQHRTRAPFHWAGYVIIGEGTQSVPVVPKPRSLVMLWATAAGLLLVIGFGMYRRRQHRRAHHAN